MKSTVEHLEPTKVKVTVEVPYEEFKPTVERAYKDIAKQVNLPGFRPGHAPARIIDQRIGRGAVIEQAVNEAMPNLYGKTVDENDLFPVGRPEIDVTSTPNLEGPLEGDLVFDVTVEVRPDFDLPELSDITLEVENGEVTDEDVQAELDELRSRFASLKSVDRAIEDKDFVVLDMSAKIGDEEVDSVSQVSYRIGSGNMLDGMDEALTGMKAGETKTFTAPLAGGEHAGEDAEVTVSPTAVKVQELPEADDEFAQMVSEHDTIGELMADLKDTAAKTKLAQQANEARRSLLKAIVEKVDFPLPQGVIEETVSQNAKEDTTDEQKAEMREATENDMREQFVLDRLAEAKKVSVSQQELLDFVLQTAQVYGIDPANFLAQAEAQNQLPRFIQEIARNKSLAVSLREVTVKDKNGNVLDLTEFIGSDEADAQAEAAEDAEADAE